MKLVLTLAVAVARAKAYGLGSVEVADELSVVMAAEESEMLCQEKVVILIAAVALLVIAGKVMGYLKGRGDYRRVVEVFACVLAASVGIPSSD